MSCCISDDGPDVFTEEWRKARKLHRCCECGSKIEIGEIYEYVKGLWDGRWSDYKSCLKCADLRDALYDVCCPYYGGLSEAYQEYLLETDRLNVPAGNHAAKLVTRLG